MKKILSLALVIVMLLGISVPVNAATTDDIYVGSVEAKNKIEGVYVRWFTNVVFSGTFNVYRRAAGEAEPTLIAENIDCFEFLDENVENGKFYMYFVSAIVDGIEGEKCESKLVRFIDAPKNISLTVVSNGIKVEWDPVPGANGYAVNYRAKGELAWRMAASATTYTSCVVKPSVTASTYEITVMARISSYYQSAQSDIFTITNVKTPKIKTIENSPEGIHIVWNNVSDTCGYRVYRRAAGEKYWTYLKTITGKCEYYDGGVKSGVYYSYTVVAEEDGQRSPVASSNPVIKHVKTPKLQAVANGADGSYIRWETVSGATKYVIYRREAGNLKWSEIGQVTSGNRFKDTTTMWGQYYRYTVVACSGNYKSGFDKNGLVIRFLPLGGTWNKTVIFNFYKGAINKVKGDNKIAPAYVAKMWQNPNGVKFTGSNKAFVSEFQTAFRSAFDTYSNAFTARPYKGTANAEKYLPYCYADPSQVKSASVTRKGSNYYVKIVFKDLGMPTNTSYGVSGVCPMYYDMVADAKEMYRSGYLNSYTASTVYKDYTITAEITPDGKLVNMTHMAPGYVNSTLNFGGDAGTVKASGKVICYSSYSNFKY